MIRPTHIYDSDAWPAIFHATPITEPMTDVVAAPDTAMDTTVWLDELDVNGMRVCVMLSDCDVMKKHHGVGRFWTRMCRMEEAILPYTRFIPYTGLLAPHAVLSIFERGRSNALGVCTFSSVHY